AQGRRRCLATQREQGKAHRQLAEEVGAVTIEDRVLLLLDDHDQVAGRGSLPAGIAEPAQGDVVPGHDAAWDVDCDRVGRRGHAFAAALRTGVLHGLAGAAALGTAHPVHELSEERGLHVTDLPAASAPGTRHPLPAATARSLARFARLEVADADLLLDALADLFQRELDADLEIVPAPLARPFASAAEQILEPAQISPKIAHERTQRVPEVEPAEVGRRASGRAAHPDVTELVVSRPLLLVAEDFVRFGRLLELLLGHLVAGVAVGVVLKGQ